MELVISMLLLFEYFVINLCSKIDALGIVYFVVSALSIFCNELHIYNQCFRVGTFFDLL